MSEENVELVRRWLAWAPDLRDLDPADDDAVLEQVFRDYLDEKFEWRLPGDFYPEGERVFRGHAGYVRYVEMLREAWSEWRYEPERFIDAGDQVVLFGRVVAKGRASGVPIQLASAVVMTITDGRITSGQVHPSRDEALKAVGRVQE